jgi:hypothetical protein
MNRVVAVAFWLRCHSPFAFSSPTDLVDTLWSARTDGELVGVVEELAALKAVIAAVEAGVVAETDLRGIAKTRLHHGSTGDWLTHLGGMRRGQGRRVVVRAHALTTTQETTRQGSVDAVVSPEQADVILATVESLPSDPVLRARARRSWSTTPGRWLPPSWPRPGVTWSRSSTPTPKSGVWSVSSPVRNVPHT